MLRADAHRDATQDPCPAINNHRTLSSLVTKCLADKVDLDCTLANLSSTPSLDTDSYKEEPQDHATDENSSSGDMKIDSSAEVNQSSTADEGLPPPLPSAKEKADKAAADAVIAAMVNFDHSCDEAPYPTKA